MTFLEVQPKQLLPEETYSNIANVAPGMDLTALRATDLRMSSEAARKADGGMALGGVAFLVAAGLIFDKVPHVWSEIWNNASGVHDVVKFPSSLGAPLGASVIAIGLVNRAVNEALYRVGFKPSATSKLNADLQDFMQSEGITNR